jgi:hypothetical protein
VENLSPPTSSDRPGLFHNWLTVIGLVVTLGGLFAFFLLFAIDAFGQHSNPYLGLLAYIVAPGFMILGMAVSALGAWLHHRHLRGTEGADRKPAITIDLNRPADRKVLIGVVLGALGFLMLTAFGSYKSYHYTESVVFCGQACHEPMKPELVAFQHSPHARVDCVECHIGEGAGAFVTAKLRGVHQLVAMLKKDFKRPIPTPIRNLRPAQETCEQCHWPQQFSGQLDRVYNHFLADETNTPFTVRLSLKVGGGDPRVREVGGIHWHVDPKNKVEYYALDERRQNIGWVRFTQPDGQVIEYRTPDFTNDVPSGQIRTMDCMDCHNRPAHIFKAPNDAVDLAMTMGKIDRAIPWIKSNVVVSLVQEYSTQSEGVEKIAGYLRAQYPGNPAIDPVIGIAQNIYTNNFFPEMKADWRAYPNNVGHKEWAGCFRCHDGNHKAVNDPKTVISANNCNACHTILAQGGPEDMLKLSAQGHDFFHIDAINEEFSCNNCHTGAFPKEL